MELSPPPHTCLPTRFCDRYRPPAAANHRPPPRCAAPPCPAAAPPRWSLFSAMTTEAKQPEVDTSDVSNSHAPSIKGLVAVPVAGGSSGEGLPYAPEDWPEPGDKCRWKVGNRPSVSGHWHDRYLYLPPNRLKSTGSRTGFQSRLSLEEFVRKEFPDTDVNAFFSSFIWRIPCSGHTQRKEKSHNSFTSRRKLDANECSGSESTIKDRDCKAGNKMCNLNMNSRGNFMAVKACDICCTEDGFCRNCSCILCSKSIDWGYGGYSFIKCEATLDENDICGHVAHIECALRTYMAGTIGGSIGLDVEYYCRRCDNRTSLIPHVTKLIKTCESLDSPDDISKILNVGLCLLRDSKQPTAENLRNQIEFIMAKLKEGNLLGDIWRVEDNIPASNAGNESFRGNKVKLEVPSSKRKKKSDLSNNGEPSHWNVTADARAQMPVYITSDYSKISVKLEEEVDLVLKKLKKSQGSEYIIAEQKLNAQKDFLLRLYQQLHSTRTELAKPTTSSNGGNYDTLLTRAFNLVQQITQEDTKFHNMMKIANGFGRMPQDALTDDFGLPCNE